MMGPSGKAQVATRGGWTSGGNGGGERSTSGAVLDAHFLQKNSLFAIDGCDTKPRCVPDPDPDRTLTPTRPRPRQRSKNTTNLKWPPKL